MLDDGAIRFIKLDGTTVDSSAPLQNGDWAQLPLQHQGQGIHIYAATAATRWAGEKCDYGLGIEVLLSQARRAAARAGNVPAGMSRLVECAQQPDINHVAAAERPNVSDDDVALARRANERRWNEMFATAIAPSSGGSSRNDS